MVIVDALHRRLRPSRLGAAEAPAAAPPAPTVSGQARARAVMRALQAKGTIAQSFEVFWRREGGTSRAGRVEAFVIWRAAWWASLLKEVERLEDVDAEASGDAG